MTSPRRSRCPSSGLFAAPEKASALLQGRPRRIHIIGTSGTSKTTLARRVVEAFGIPSYDLDVIGYEGAFEGRPGIRRPLDDRLHDISQIASQPAWVTDGIFLWWVDELLKKADLIVWLDLHWLTASWRVVRRELRRKIMRAKTHRLRSLPSFVWSMRTAYRRAEPLVPSAPDDDVAISRAGILTELARYQEKTVRCATQRYVGVLLKSLSNMKENR